MGLQQSSTLRVSICAYAVLVSAAAHADRPPGAVDAPTDPAPDDPQWALPKVRLRWIRAQLEQEAGAAKWWWYGWTAFNGAAMGVQGTVAAATNDRGVRQDMIVGAATALVGFSAMFFIPFSPRYAADQLRDVDHRATTERQLLRAERLLQRAAEDEAAGRSWLSHLGNFVIAAASSAVLLALDRPESAVINFGSAFVVGEIFIFSQPNDLIAAWSRYRTRQPSAGDGPEVVVR